MSRLPTLLSRTGSLATFLLLQAISLYLVVSFNSEQRAIWQETASVYFGSYQQWMAENRAYLDLDEANRQLQRENAELRGRLAASNYALQPDTSSVTDSLFLQRYRHLATRVVNRSPYGPNNTLIIDRGSDFGVAVGQGVIGPEGLIGIVSTVTSRHARLISVLHLNARISAGLKNKAYGTMRWDGRDPRTVQVTDLPDYVPVSPGDTVYTTGYSSVFPTGVIIGTVERSVPLPGTGSQNLDVRLINAPLYQDAGYVVQDLFKEEFQTLNQVRCPRQRSSPAGYGF